MEFWTKFALKIWLFTALKLVFFPTGSPIPHNPSLLSAPHFLCVLHLLRNCSCLLFPSSAQALTSSLPWLLPFLFPWPLLFLSRCPSSEDVLLQRRRRRRPAPCIDCFDCDAHPCLSLLLPLFVILKQMVMMKALNINGKVKMVKEKHNSYSLVLSSCNKNWQKREQKRRLEQHNCMKMDENGFYKSQKNTNKCQTNGTDIRRLFVFNIKAFL